MLLCAVWASTPYDVMWRLKLPSAVKKQHGLPKHTTDTSRKPHTKQPQESSQPELWLWLTENIPNQYTFSVLRTFLQIKKLKRRASCSCEEKNKWRGVSFRLGIKPFIAAGKLWGACCPQQCMLSFDAGVVWLSSSWNGPSEAPNQKTRCWIRINHSLCSAMLQPKGSMVSHLNLCLPTLSDKIGVIEFILWLFSYIFFWKNKQS